MSNAWMPTPQRRPQCWWSGRYNSWLASRRAAGRNRYLTSDPQRYQKVTSAQYEEADIIEEWRIDRGDDGVSLDDATVEIDTWLTGDKTPSSPRARLEDFQRRSAVRREAGAHLQALRSLLRCSTLR